MAFSETDDTPTGGAWWGVALDWLRELFTEDWGLKLLAMVITLGLWYGVTSQRAPGTVRLRGVQLYFLRPDDVEIANEPREEIEVTLRGRSSALDDLIGRRDLVATVNITNLKLGERIVRLTPENISMDLPEGVRVEKVEPGSVPLRLERRVERDVLVGVRLEGEVPEGYEVYGVEITPRRVRVRGPESHVNALEKAPTETVSLDAQTQTLTLPQTAIDITDGKVIALDPVVSVRVEIGEKRIERRFAGVAVSGGDGGAATPSTASVLVRGARTVVESLNAEQLKIVLEQPADGAPPRTRLVVSTPGADGRVELISTSPSEFSLDK